MGKKSVWWSHFQKVDQRTAKCNYCGLVLKTSGNTSNLKCHIEAKHDLVIGTNTNNAAPTRSSPRKKVQLQRRKRISSDEDEHPIDDPGVSGVLSSLPSTSKTPALDPPPAKKNRSQPRTLHDMIKSQTAATSAPAPTPLLAQKDLIKVKTSAFTTSLAGEEENRKVQTTLEKSFSMRESFQEGGSRYSSITGGIAFMLCKDNLPFATVEKPGFRKLMHIVAPLYKPPSRQTIKSLILKKYATVSEIFKKKFESVNSFTVTSDIWTDTMQSRSFLGATIHYYDGDEGISSCSLGIIELDESHTAEYIATTLDDLLREWGLNSSNIFAVVTDGGANIVKAVELQFGKKKHQHCFAHILNLIAQKSLEQENVDALIKKVKKIVTWFKQSVVAADKLRKSGCDLKLIQCVETRWNSTYYMICRFLEVKHFISEILQNSTSTTAPAMTSGLENEILREVRMLLCPLEKATRVVSGDQYVTSSMVIPTIKNMTDRIKDISPKYSITELFKTTLMEQIKKRVGSNELNLLLSVSTLLDPRFKKVYFNDPEAIAKALNEIKFLLKKDFLNAQSPQNKHHSSQSDPGSSTGDENEDESPLFSEHCKKVHVSFKKQTAIRSTSEASFEGLPDQLALYIRAPADGDILKSPLKYWKNMAPSSPELSRLAIKYLSSVATSVPCERLFSKTGLILTKERNRLKGKTLSKLLFLQSVGESVFL